MKDEVPVLQVSLSRSLTSPAPFPWMLGASEGLLAWVRVYLKIYQGFGYGLCAGTMVTGTLTGRWSVSRGTGSLCVGLRVWALDSTDLSVYPGFTIYYLGFSNSWNGMGIQV